MLIRLVITLVAVYGALLLLLFLFQPRLLFLPGVPGRSLTATPADSGLDFESVELETSDGETLHGWWIPHQRARGVVLFHHGNAGNISHRLESLRIFHGLGLSVLIYDYRGYGRSTGKPSESGLAHDAEAAWKWLVEERGIAPERIVLFGRSMGAAVAARLARDVGAAGLIVESAFTSVPDIGAELYWWLPVRWLSRLQFATADYVADADMPVLVIHSSEDEIIPFEHGRRIHEAAPEPKTLMEIHGDHNTGFLISGERYRRGLDAFVDRHLDRGSDP